MVAVCGISAERWPVVHISERAGPPTSRRDPQLVKLLQRARQAQRLVEDNRDVPVKALAGSMRCGPGHFSRLIRLNFLAPDIVTAILDGVQPPGLTRDIVLKANLPMDWVLQRKLFGFAEPERAILTRQLYGRGMWPATKRLRPETMAMEV